MNKNKITKIITQKYYNINDVTTADIENKKGFIISNEYKKKTGEIGRYYTIFPNLKIFLKNRHLFPHCHEILIDHKNKPHDKSGRLVFDFDINYSTVNGYIPYNFKDQIESVILDIVFINFKNIDASKIIFVWSSSENQHKLSKHLTVKNLYFEDWIETTKLFYNLFCKMWSEHYDWISANDLIDSQIARNRASLRMVGSKKINGNILKFDDTCFCLEDSLIRIYKKNHREQMITISDINSKFFKELYLNSDRSNYEIQENDFRELIAVNNIILDKDMISGDSSDVINTKSKFQTKNFEKIIYSKINELQKKIFGNVFQMGQISGNLIHLIRNNSNTCVLCIRQHTNENAYISVEYVENIHYHIRFGCYRCKNKNSRLKTLGIITAQNHMIFPDDKTVNEYNNLKNIKYRNFTCE